MKLAKKMTLTINGAKANNITVTNPELVKEWDWEKNVDLRPETITQGSGKKVWWVCAEGHRWEAQVASRSRGARCPYCTGKIAVAGQTDLATLYPEIAAQWDYAKNGDLRPEMFTKGSGKKVWWVCDEGHEWEASINGRTNGNCCPFCANKKVLSGYNDVATKAPELARLWDYDKNDGLLPTQVARYSSRKVWLKCDAGHSFRIKLQTCKNVRCPECTQSRIVTKSYNLLVTHPQIASQWHAEKNGESRPEQFTKGSHKVAWWLCEVCGLEWQTSINARTNNNTGCPRCSGRYHDTGASSDDLDASLMDARPEVASMWDYSANKNTPNDVSVGSHAIAYWVCDKNPEHKWARSVTSMVAYGKCPFCSDHSEIYMPSKKKPKKGRSFADLYPEASEEWCQECNGAVTPNDISRGTHYDYWWRCKKHGVVWSTQPNNRAKGNGCPACRAEKVSASRSRVEDGKSLADLHPDIANEWDMSLNVKTPDKVMAHAREKAHWVCSYGHKWVASVYSRTLTGCGCPICSNKKVQPGINDLATTHPDIAKGWHPSLNGDVKPTEVTCGSTKPCWWICDKGHSWDASPYVRVHSLGCPFCSGKRVLAGFNDLSTTHPQVVAEWDFDKNGDLLPSDVSYGSNTNVWWTCENGHSWIAKVSDRVRGSSCPYCSCRKPTPGVNDLSTSHPDLASEWHQTLNGDKTPDQFSRGSDAMIWWECSLGHAYDMTIANRVAGKGCPYCSNPPRRVLPGFNDLASANPKLAREWHPKKNGSLKPSMVTKASSELVWWRCNKGHEWQATVVSRHPYTNCPVCISNRFTSFPEKALCKYILTSRDVENARPDIPGLGRMEFDIWLPDVMVAIEYDGERWHQDVGKDLRKDKVCADNGIRIIRIREPKCPVYESNAEFVYRKDTTTSESLNEVIRQVCRMVGRDDSDVDVDRDRHIIEQMVEYKPGDQTGVYHQLSLF